MKKLLYLPFFIATLLACREQEQDVVTPEVPEPKVVAFPIPTVSLNRLLLPGDPNLDLNWDWEESAWYLYFQNDEGGISWEISSINPFYAATIFGHGDPTKIDIRAVNGWMLVARDFGTPTSAPRIPYAVFYNRYRGLLRVCALRTTHSSTPHQTTSLSFEDTTVASPLLRFAGETEQMATSKTGPQDWMVSEFNVQGYDALVERQARFTLHFREEVRYDMHLASGSTIEDVVQPKPSRRSFNLTEGTFGISSYSSSRWDLFGELGGANFQKAISAIGPIQEDPLTLTNAVGGALMSFTSAGLGPNYNLSLGAKNVLQGMLGSEVYLGTVSIYLQKDAEDANQPKALQTIPWGVMNYTDAVSLYTDQENKGQVSARPGFFDDILLINPAIASDVATVEAGWIFSNVNEVAFAPLRKFKSDGINGSSNYPVAVGVRLIFNNGDVVYNRIPVQMM